jgi:hypothetical protein
VHEEVGTNILTPCRGNGKMNGSVRYSERRTKKRHRRKKCVYPLAGTYHVHNAWTLAENALVDQRLNIHAEGLVALVASTHLHSSAKK